MVTIFEHRAPHAANHLDKFRGTIALDAVGIVPAAFGRFNPLFAAFIHVASELAFILNSARLLPLLDGTERGGTR